MKRSTNTGLLRLALAVMLVQVGVMSLEAAAAKSFFVHIGTYTGPRSQGIYVSRFDAGAGTLTPPELAAETKNPTFLALHPTKAFLYAVGELNDFEGKKAGAVSAFSMDPKTGKLTLLNQQASGGTGPCHLSVDHSGRCVLVANYGSGSVAALPLSEDGKLGTACSQIQHEGSSINPKRQAGPHAHFISPDPANQFALSCDLGLDKILVYKLDAAKALLQPNQPPWAAVEPGAGPRHVAFSPNGHWVYLASEMGCTLTSFQYNAARGTLKTGQTVSTLPAGFTGQNTCAEVQAHPSGKYVYVSNRGHDSIAMFAVETEGKLKPLGHQSTQGKNPRHFALVPGGDWLLAENQDSASVVVFKVSPDSGTLTPTGRQIEIGSPVCVVFSPVR